MLRRDETPRKITARCTRDKMSRGLDSQRFLFSLFLSRYQPARDPSASSHLVPTPARKSCRGPSSAGGFCVGSKAGVPDLCSRSEIRGPGNGFVLKSGITLGEAAAQPGFGDDASGQAARYFF